MRIRCRISSDGLWAWASCGVLWTTALCGVVGLAYWELSVPLGSFAYRVQVQVEKQLESRKDPCKPLSGEELNAIVRPAAARHQLKPELVLAIVRHESRGMPCVVNKSGAAGLLQLMPPAARRFGALQVFDPQSNIEAGVRYLKWLSDRYRGNTALVLAAYSAGHGAVDSHRGVPPFTETERFVSAILNNIDE